MKIETMSKLATIILCSSVVAIVLGLFSRWIFVVIGAVGLIIFEILSAYIHEWYVEQNEEKF